MYKDLRTYALVLSCIAMGVLSGCSEKEEAGELPTHITFATSIGEEVSATRAVDDKWDKDNDKVGIFMTNSSYGQYSTYTYFGNKQHYPNQSGSVSCELKPVSGDQLYYPTNGDAVGFVGYYPYKLNSKLDAAYKVKIDATQTASNMKDFDLLWCRTATTFDKKPTTPNPSLTFVHQLSKIVVEVTLAAPAMTGGSVQKVEMTAIPLEADFALSTGMLSKQATPTAVRLHQVTANKDYLGIIIPHTSGTLFKSRTLKFSITDPTGNTATLLHPILDTHEFKKDNIYTYKVTLTRKEVLFTGCTIKPWGTNNEEDVTLGN